MSRRVEAAMVAYLRTLSAFPRFSALVVAGMAWRPDTGYMQGGSHSGKDEVGKDCCSHSLEELEQTEAAAVQTWVPEVFLPPVTQSGRRVVHISLPNHWLYIVIRIFLLAAGRLAPGERKGTGVRSGAERDERSQDKPSQGQRAEWLEEERGAYDTRRRGERIVNKWKNWDGCDAEEGQGADFKVNGDKNGGRRKSNWERGWALDRVMKGVLYDDSEDQREKEMLKQDEKRAVRQTRTKRDGKEESVRRLRKNGLRRGAKGVDSGVERRDDEPKQVVWGGMRRWFRARMHTDRRGGTRGRESPAGARSTGSKEKRPGCVAGRRASRRRNGRKVDAVARNRADERSARRGGVRLGQSQGWGTLGTPGRQRNGSSDNAANEQRQKGHPEWKPSATSIAFSPRKRYAAPGSRPRPRPPCSYVPGILGHLRKAPLVIVRLELGRVRKDADPARAQGGVNGDGSRRRTEEVTGWNTVHEEEGG
ncbi:hypothetical protein B0H17DRAFT_1132713 [Mycena rosella]|uniref:Uncharacterized protein n=1 Tax=Mycena rosella TaxID=1033263 RepID=A0AAD7GIY7_MYCRO|nr:hypothetical protein B0H17DRAFT_1132713 [Mycena rosella]